MKRPVYLWIVGNMTKLLLYLNHWGDYKESPEKLMECKSILDQKDALSILKTVKKGDVIQYGNYEGHTDWIVVDIVENEKVKLLSKESIGNMPFNNPQSNGESSAASWENYSLRNWLNDTYFNSAFSEAERNRILYTNIEVEDHYTSNSTKEIQDKVFILNIETKDEILPYLSEDVKNMWAYSTLDDSMLSSESYVIYRYRTDNGREIYMERREENTSDNPIYPEIWIDISDL